MWEAHGGNSLNFQVLPTMLWSPWDPVLGCAASRPLVPTCFPSAEAPLPGEKLCPNLQDGEALSSSLASQLMYLWWLNFSPGIGNISFTKRGPGVLWSACSRNVLAKHLGFECLVTKFVGNQCLVANIEWCKEQLLPRATSSISQSPFRRALRFWKSHGPESTPL